jgi:hypothetical protein
MLTTLTYRSYFLSYLNTSGYGNRKNICLRTAAQYAGLYGVII